MSKIRKIGAGWRTKSGKGYNCILDEDMPKGGRFLMLKNEKKENDKHPDINLVIFEEEGEEAPF